MIRTISNTSLNHDSDASNSILTNFGNVEYSTISFTETFLSSGGTLLRLPFVSGELRELCPVTSNVQCAKYLQMRTLPNDHNLSPDEAREQLFSEQS